jgi:hypothetical protein
MAVVATYDTARGALAVGWQEPDLTFRFHFPDGVGDAARGLGPATSDVGAWPSLAIGRDGMPRVAFYDRREGDLRYARFDGASWRVERVDGQDADVGRHASLALDAGGRPHIASYDATRGALRYATLTEAGWLLETVPVDRVASAAFPRDAPGGPWGGRRDWPLGAPPDYGRFASIGVSLGAPVVAFYEATGGDLLLARRTSGGWTVLLLDGRDPVSGEDRGDVGQHASLAVDARGDVNVAYFDATAGALRFVRGASGDMAVQIVDDGTRSPEGAEWPNPCARHVVGQRAALALAADGRARVAYLDATDLTLRWAESVGSGRWTRRTLDGEPGAGLWIGHDTRGSASFVAYAHLDLYRARPTELRVLRVEP